MQTHDGFDFSPHLFGIIGTDVRRRRMKQRPSRHADVNDQRQLPGNGSIAHQRTQLPGVGFVQLLNLKFLLLNPQPLNTVLN